MLNLKSRLEKKIYVAPQIRSQINRIDKLEMKSEEPEIPLS